MQSTFDQSDYEQLIKFAEQEFSLSGGSNSRRAQLENAWRQLGVKPKELDELIELPESMHMVWNYFIDLNNTRTSNGFGLNPISFTEIKSYFDLYCITPMSYEIAAIKALDRVALDCFNKEQEKSSKSKSKK